MQETEIKQSAGAGSDTATCSTEDAVIDLIRARGVRGRVEHQASMDRRDYHPDQWIANFQEELADGLQYGERIKGQSKLLHEARDIMCSLIRERDWDCAREWVKKYDSQFLLNV